MNVLRIKTCPELLDPIYAYYLFKTEYFRKNIDNIRKDAINQSSISISDINNIILELPVISLQKSTASILSSIDRKIELNRSINHNLRARREQRRIVFSLCRADAVNGDVSRNFEAMPVRSSVREGVSHVA